MPTPDRVVVPLESTAAAAVAAVADALAAHPRSRTVLFRAASAPDVEVLAAALAACAGRAGELEAPAPADASEARAWSAAGLRRAWLRGPASAEALAALREGGVRVALTFDLAAVTPRALAAELERAVAAAPWLGSITVSAEPGAPTPDLEELRQALGRARTITRAAGVSFSTQGIPACVADPDGEAAGHRRPRLSADLVWGAPCPPCALRPVCVGAPATWWAPDEGLVSPEAIIEPWEPAAGTTRLQTVVRGFGEPVEGPVRAAPTPTVWLWTDRLQEADLPLPFTHLAIELTQARIELDTLQRLRRVGRPVHAGLRMGPVVVDVRAMVHALESVGVHTVALLAPESWVEAEVALRLAFPQLDVRRIGPPAEG